MPTTPNALIAIVSQPPSGPQIVKRTDPEKSAVVDFRQILATVKPATAAIANATATQATGTMSNQAMADSTEATSIAPQNIPKTPETVQPIGIKRAKKTPGQTPAIGTAIAGAPQQSLATSAATAAPGPALLTAPVTLTPAAPAPEPPKAATPEVAPTPAALLAAGPHRSDAVISNSNVKSGKAEPEPNNPIETPVFSPASQIIPAPIGSENLDPASHLSTKGADITRQVAAALPHISSTNASPNTALHISLTPETLGTITVKVTQHVSGETAVTISATHPETLAVLKHDAPNLNQILTNAGIPEANRQVNFQTTPVTASQNSSLLGNASGGQNGTNGQPQQQPGTPFANPVSRPTPPAANPTTQSRSGHARSNVDVIA